MIFEQMENDLNFNVKIMHHSTLTNKNVYSIQISPLY